MEVVGSAAYLAPGVLIDDESWAGLHKVAETVQQTEAPAQDDTPQCNCPVNLRQHLLAQAQAVRPAATDIEPSVRWNIT